MADTTDPSVQAKKDLAESYRTMMGLGAWKHFEKEILSRVEAQAMKDEDSMELKDLTPAAIGECRGRRNAVRKIKTDLDYILNSVQ